jgi:hypothetical protein
MEVRDMLIPVLCFLVLLAIGFAFAWTITHPIKIGKMLRIIKFMMVLSIVLVPVHSQEDDKEDDIYIIGEGPIILPPDKLVEASHTIDSWLVGLEDDAWKKGVDYFLMDNWTGVSGNNSTIGWSVIYF